MTRARSGKTPSDTRPTDADSPWKEVLELYFEKFVAFFFPDIFGVIDWAKGHEFLDKELQQIFPDAATGRRTVDKLVKVWLQDGTEIWTVVHVEIQGKADPNFTKRMYMYNYRLFDKHDRKIVSLAVLTDSRKNWRPDRYGYELCGCKVELVFPMVKLLDYQRKWEDLEKSENPFSVVVMAHLKHLETRRDMDGRLRWKSSLVKMLYRRGFQRKDILELFRFIDWILKLPEAMEERFSDEICRYEEDMKMPYVTSVERQGMRQGIRRGTLLTFREAVMNVLEARFGTIPKSVKNGIGMIDDPELLKMLHGKAVLAGSLKDFKEILSGAGSKANA